MPDYFTEEYLEHQRERLIAIFEVDVSQKNDGPNLVRPVSQFRVKFAIKRIDTGQYGICCDCGCCVRKEFLEQYTESPFCELCEAERCTIN